MGGGGSTAKEKAEAKATKEADKQMAQVEEADSSKVRTRWRDVVSFDVGQSRWCALDRGPGRGGVLV